MNEQTKIRGYVVNAMGNYKDRSTNPSNNEVNKVSGTVTTKRRRKHNPTGSEQNKKQQTNMNKSPFTRFDIFTVSDIFSIRCLSVGVFRRYGNLTVHRTQPYTVLGFQLHSYRMCIKTHEDGLEYIYSNILVSQVSSTATNFKSKILGTSYCETKEYFGLF